MYTENASKAHGEGILDLTTFEPFPKNPAISKVFRETSLADELGSGMRNTYKYTQLYSGGIPEFIEGNVFKTIVPLDAVSVGKVGPNMPLQVDPQVDPHNNISSKIIFYCRTPRSKKEIAIYCEYKDVKSFSARYLKPLINNGTLQMTIPHKPRSKNQKYVAIPPEG